MSAERLLHRAILAVIELHDTGFSLPAARRMPLIAINRALTLAGLPRIHDLDDASLQRATRALEQGA